MGQGRRKGLRGAWVRALGCAGRHSQSSRMTLASTMTRAPRLMPAPPARSAAAPGRQVPSWPQRHTVTFRGCSRCCGGCPESRSSRLRRYRPSWTWCRSCRRAWLTARALAVSRGEAAAPSCPSTSRPPLCLCLGWAACCVGFLRCWGSASSSVHRVCHPSLPGPRRHHGGSQWDHDAE